MSEPAIPVAEAARDFLRVLDLVESRREPATLLRDGKPVARLVPISGAAATCEELADRWENLNACRRKKPKPSPLISNAPARLAPPLRRDENRLLIQSFVRYILAMKRAEVQLPDPLYQQVEGLAEQLQLSVPELLVRAAEQLVRHTPATQATANGRWLFPKGRHLGPFCAPVADWRLLANEPAAE